MKIHIKDIKCGDLFWEKFVQFEALEDGQHAGTINLPGNPNADQWKVRAKLVGDTYHVIEFLTTEESAYGPHLDTENMYREFN